MTARTFHKTALTVVILSEAPYTYDTLQDVVDDRRFHREQYEIRICEQRETLDAAALLAESGVEPDRFQPESPAAATTSPLSEAF